MAAKKVLKFWFEEHGPDDWYSGLADFDAKLVARFATTHAELAAGEGFSWRGDAHGRLAEIIVLDQFSRQIFRNDRRAFASDGMALVLAEEAVAGGHAQKLNASEHAFLLMPYMHSESVIVHEEAVRLFTALGNEGMLKYEISHFDVIKKFGRFPKRNDALGRVSTLEEIAYIAGKDGMF